MAPNSAQYVLTRAVADVVNRGSLITRMHGPRPLRIKYGVDPTAPDIHLGHAVCFRKLRQFQDLGHTVVVIIGDWTAQIGDPSGRNATRKMLSREQVLANAQTYLDQFFNIVDRERTEVRWQSDWFGPFGLRDVIQLTSHYTVAQALARDDFGKRYAEGRPILVTELLYALLQGYDSIAIEADVELGGVDQTLNLLLGRELQRAWGQTPQETVTLPILVGLDGRQKMSKSLGNYIGITEDANSMYGKTMSLPDEAIWPYFRGLTDIPDTDLAEMEACVSAGDLNPRDAKMRLAAELVRSFHGPAAAEEAEHFFVRTVQQHELPEDMPTHSINADWNTLPLANVLVACGLAPSRSEARRLIGQGGVRLNGEAVTDAATPVVLKPNDVLQVGKRRYTRLTEPGA